jgi:threonyl-tRNA synthetase
VDERSETLGFKIRDAETRKIPLMLVIGDREQEDGTVTPRQRHIKKSGEAIAPADLVAQLSEHIAERRTGPIS